MYKDLVKDVQVVRDITEEMVESIRQSGLRPGIKFLPYTPSYSEVLMGTLPLDGIFPLRFNLPGGGIDEGQSAAEALCREAEEELGITTFTVDSVANLPVVSHGELPFRRDEYRGKYEFIVATPFQRLDTITSLPGSKMLLWPPMDWRAAQVEVLTLAYGGTEMVALYAQALAAIPNLLDR